MSDRTHLGEVSSSVEEGEHVELYRDNDTKSYRIFTYSGHRTVDVLGRYKGCQFDSCEDCDLSIDDLKKLADIINRAVAAHEPWPNYDGRSEPPK